MSENKSVLLIRGENSVRGIYPWHVLIAIGGIIGS